MAGNNSDINRMFSLKEQNRCIKCKRRMTEDTVTCVKCLEFKYCSIECLEADRDDHRVYCSHIGVKKGILTPVTEEEAQRFQKVKEKARYLNDDGSLRSEDPDDEKSDKEESDNDEDKQATAWKPKRKGKKKRKSKRGHRRNKGNNSNGAKGKEGDLDGENDVKKTAESLLTGGSFGGAVRVDKKVASGASFGEGWWKPRVETKKTKVKETFEATASGATGTSKKMKFKYDDDDDDDDEEEDDEKETSSTADGAGASLEEAMSGLELVKYDPKKAEEESIRYRTGRSDNTVEKCSYCSKEGVMLKCSRCKLAKYCNKICQQADYKNHKEVCRRKERFDIAMSRLPQSIKLLLLMRTGSLNISPFLSDIQDEFSFMFLGPRRGFHIMVEIIDEHPHPFRYGAMVRDLRGRVTQVLFYMDTHFYRPVGLFSFPIPLSRCLRPGNFMLLLDVHWHFFMDGTVGIRINDEEEVYFILME